MPGGAGLSRVGAIKGVDMRTLETDFVALQTLHGLFEEALARGGESRYVILLPLDRSINMLEDLLDRVGDFCTNTIARNQSDLAHKVSFCVS